MTSGGLKSLVESRRTWLACALALAVFAVFSPVLRADFVFWDDNYNIHANPHLGSLSWGQLKWAFADFTYAWRYQPLTWVTWSAIHTFFGWNPRWYHLAVLLFHAGNTVLVFLLADRLLRESNGNPEVASSRRMTCAAVAATLWALHPMRVENTAWAVELLFAQSAFFFLLALLAYMRKWQPGKPGATNGFPWAALFWFVVSLLSYPLALGGLVVFTVLDFYPLRRLDEHWREWLQPPARRVWLEKTPFLLVSLLAAGASLYARAHTTGPWPKPPSLEEFGGGSRLMQALYVWAYYIWKPWFPFHLSPLPTNLADFSPVSWPACLSAALVVGITALVLWKRRPWPWALALWVSYLVLLVPMLGLTERPHFTCDRYDYLPGLVWSLAIGAALWQISSRSKVWAAGLSCAVGLAVLWAALSAGQTRVWHDSTTLFSYLLRELGNHPWSAEVHWRLGSVLVRQGKTDDSVALEPPGDDPAAQGRFDEAETHFAEAVRLRPDYPEALNDLGLLRVMRGKLEEGAELCRRAIAVQPRNWRAHNNLARALSLEGKFDEAVHEYQTVLELEPGATATRGLLAAALVELGRTNEARTVFEDGLKFKADDVVVHFQYASLLLALGQAEPAALHFREVLRYAPGNAEAHRRYGLLLLGSGQTQEAGEQFREAIRLQPGAEVHYNLATALLQQGQPEQAVLEYRESLRLKPDSPAVLNDLAWVLAANASGRVRNGADAVSLAERACQLTQFREPLLLGTLAASYAEAGQFEEARSTAQKAIALAEAAGQAELAARNRELLELYKEGKPYRQ
jgi:protein O-mannosyl-transferase